MSAGRVLAAVAALLGLVLVYALALGSVEPLDLLTGAIAGALVLVAFRGLRLAPTRVGARELIARALYAPAYLLITARELLVGTWRVSRAILARRPVETAGVVTLPMGRRSDTGVVVSALAISLTPGELVLDLDWERRLMLVHALDARDPDAIRDAQDHLYERHQRRVFP